MYIPHSFSIGIDEAGRGSWAGPVVAGGFCVPLDFNFSLLPGLTDSKQLTHKKREALYQRIENLASQGKCIFASAESSAELIDSVGIREANRRAMEAVIREIMRQKVIFSQERGDTHHIKQHTEYTLSHSSPESDKNRGGTANIDITSILIDGRDGYIFDEVKKEKVKYIVHGDMTEPIISAGSIIAKVVRDRRMCEFSRKYALWGFDTHKGYGTAKHKESILNHGISFIHRKSFAPMKNIDFTHFVCKISG